MEAPPQILLVMSKGVSRDAARRTLELIGARVAVAGNPYEGTARFAESPTDLVVASLAGWRRRDLGFLTAVRSRSARTALLLLVPEGHRRLAVQALEAGADAYLLEPSDPAELAAVARRLLARPLAAPSTGDAAGIARLSGEVAHAVNNPLQVLNLLLEEAGSAKASPPGTDVLDGMRREVKRIRDAVEILTVYARLSRPAPVRASLGEIVADRLAAAREAGLAEPLGPPPRPEVQVLADVSQVRQSLDSILQFLAARSADRPVSLRGIARRVLERGRPRAEAAIRARGVHLAASEWPDLTAAVLLTDDRTRLPYPGLALPRAVAESHGGTLTFRETEPGTVLALRFPGG